jgi:plastocyanin
MLNRKFNLLSMKKEAQTANFAIHYSKLLKLSDETILSLLRNSNWIAFKDTYTLIIAIRFSHKIVQMKRQSLILVLILSPLGLLWSQTNFNVDVQSNFFSPESLTINVGDMVTWTNLGGFHNVNGEQSTYPDNPESFGNGGPSSANWSYSYTFNTPGTYAYQCDPHVGLGMVGTIEVQAASGATDLIISGVYDGPLSGGQPKGIELYVLNDIADLSIYGVSSANNGGGATGAPEFTFPNQAATAGTYLYLADDEDGFTNFFGFAPDFIDDVSNSMAINGDDAVELFQNGMVVDVFGEVDTDGTDQPWEYLDGWAYRVNGTGPDGSTFVLSNWTFSGINVFDGESSNATASVPFPIGTYSPSGSGALTANNDIAVTEINQAVTIDVLNNDLVPNPVTDFAADDGSNGTTVANMDNTVTYTPNTDFCGEDSFTYEVCDAEGCATATVTVTVNCPIDYPEYTIGLVTTTDVDGAADSVGVTCQLQGFVYGVNLRPSGLQFTIIDNSSDGIGVFNGNNNFGYTVQEGDEVIIQGEVTQFSGLIQMNIDTVWTVSTGNTLLTPTIVTALGEATESQLVTIEEVSLVDPAAWGGGTSGFNVDVTDGTNTYTVRIDNDVDLFNLPAPTGTFNVTGIGGQFDNSSPFDDGYQLLPRYMEDIDPYVVEMTSYPSYTIGEVTTVDSEGIADSIDVTCELTGVVYGVNLRNTGLQFTMIDSEGDGIAVFSQSSDFGYTVQEGDEVSIQGAINQFNGLIQLAADTLDFLSSGNTLLDPDVVTDLGENTESQLIQMNNMTLVNPDNWLDDGSSFNVDITDGNNVFTMRVDNNTTLAGTGGPGANTFNVTGIGGQFDADAPFDSDYQILPRYLEDLDVMTSTNDFNATKGFSFYPNPASHTVEVRLEEQYDVLQITDIVGTTHYLLRNPDLTEHIDLSDFSAGMYLITLIKDERAVSEKMIVTK